MTQRSRERDESGELDAAMQRYAAGDGAAFQVVYAGAAPRIRLFLRRLCGSFELADDLLQETFLRLHRARGSFGPGASVLPWVYAIARNCYIDNLRAQRARPRPAATVVEGDEAVVELSTGRDASAEEQSIARQTAELVERELARMTLARREAFVLLRYEGMSVAEAAEVLGVSEGAVKLRAFHAYEALRRALDREASPVEEVNPTPPVAAEPFGGRQEVKP
jgi:RNA polymerase sigma-70 factor (ECF subfamily)